MTASYVRLVNGVEGPGGLGRQATRHDSAVGRAEDRVMDALRRAQRAGTPVRASIVLGVAALALVVDWVTGPDTPAMLEYAIAASVAAWLCGLHRAAVVVSATLLFSVVLTLRIDDGMPAWQLWVNAAIRAATLLLVMVVVAALRRHIDRAEFVAHVDPLTGAGRAVRCSTDSTSLSHQANRTGAPLSVLYLDLDRLKAVNDTLGHAAGDEVIRRFRASSCATAGAATCSAVSAGTSSS